MLKRIDISTGSERTIVAARFPMWLVLPLAITGLAMLALAIGATYEFVRGVRPEPGSTWPLVAVLLSTWFIGVAGLGPATYRERLTLSAGALARDVSFFGIRVSGKRWTVEDGARFALADWPSFWSLRTRPGRPILLEPGDAIPFGDGLMAESYVRQAVDALNAQLERRNST